MRYEHLTLDLSTAACDRLKRILDDPPTPYAPSYVEWEIENLRNELRSRLQRTDQDPNYDPIADLR